MIRLGHIIVSASLAEKFSELMADYTCWEYWLKGSVICIFLHESYKKTFLIASVGCLLSVLDTGEVSFFLEI